MVNDRLDIVFGAMDIKESVFFAETAKRLEIRKEQRTGMIIFHEGGEEAAQKKGVPFFSVQKRSPSQPLSTDDFFREIEARHKIVLKNVIRHEMIYTHRLDESVMLQKFGSYYRTIESILKEYGVRCVVQELGGFIGTQALYYASQALDIDHVFIEPAMFPKRLVFTLNSFYADIPGDIPTGPQEETERLVQNYLQNKVVAIPSKDRRFFQDMTFFRVFSTDNLGRLFRKLYRRYILRQREEYTIGWYILYHLLKLMRRKILSFYYSQPRKERYLYFPFHVPMDAQITVRCPEFLDQESLVDYINRCIPHGYKLYIKEHPAAIGAHPVSALKRVLKYGNVRLIHPRQNSFDLIKNADCVVTINSKVGVEAIVQGRPVLMLGKGFYKGKGVTVDVENIKELAGAIRQALNREVDPESRERFIRQVYGWSYPGELYENSEQSLDVFGDSLWKFLETHRTKK